MKEIKDFFTSLFGSSDSAHRWQYSRWPDVHGWVYIFSDLLIWLSFFSIPFFVTRYFSKKQLSGIIKRTLFVTCFMFACGIIFFLDSTMFWFPAFRYSALVHIVTAILSVVTVYYIVRYLPRAFLIQPLSELKDEVQQRKKAEIELALSEKRFKSLVQEGGDMMAILDDKGNYNYVSSSSEAILGISPEEFFGKNVFDFIHHEDRERVHDSFAQLQDIKTMKVAPFRFLNKDGNYLWLETVITNLKDEPAVNGIVVNSRDITDRLSASQKIAESEKQYAYLIQNLPIAFYTCDEYGRIVSYNKAAATLWGREPRIGKDLWFGALQIYRPDGTEMAPEESPAAIALRRKKSVPGMEIMLKRPDGATYSVLHYPSPLFNSAGELTGAMNVLIDITERKNMYAKLVKTEMDIRNFAKQQNNLLEDERSRIAREIHDEFGQQLAGIKMSLSTLVRSYQHDKQAVDVVKSMVSEVDNTMQSLRKFATELRPGILDTLGLITSIEWLIEEFESKTGIKSRVHVNVRDHKFEKALSTCFFRICQEALTNILKHAQATEITVQITQPDDKLKLTIEDNGKGIVTEKLDNPFSMGILGMRERANLIGAKLSITSEPNAGTMIILIAKINGA
ncbi:MAG: PAS domain S-box protein [Ferruginibacter sp.]